MTALLELKQRIKNLYSQYEIYILPVLRFVLAMVFMQMVPCFILLVSFLSREAGLNLQLTLTM